MVSHGNLHTVPERPSPNLLFVRATVWLGLLALIGLSPLPSIAAVFTVDSTSPTGDTEPGDGPCRSTDTQQCTLRAAIEEANTLPGRDRIEFASTLPLDPDGFARIQPTTALVVTDALEIDGRSAPGFDPSPEIPQPIVHLIGDGTFVDGLHYTAAAGGSAVHALAIVGFGRDGIDIEGGSDWLIQGCHIGLEGGSVVRGNRGDGIEFHSTSTGGVVGADFDPEIGFLGAGNVFVENGLDGIDTPAGLTLGGTGHRAAGNRIGTTPDGRSSEIGGQRTGNVATGIAISNDGSLITEFGYARTMESGIEVSRGNVVSANGSTGLIVQGIARVRGNYVGTSIDGDAGDGGLGNGLHGIELNDSASSLFEDNVISGNGGCGAISGSHGASGAIFIGNRIGVTGDATAALGNERCGIELPIGQFERNWVGGNAGHGITLFDNSHGVPADFSSTLVGNWIGTNESGNDLGNEGDGIHLTGPYVYEVGGALPSDANTIGFNATGIRMPSTPLRAHIRGNYIGTDAAGRNLGNSGPGVSVGLSGSVGGPDPGDGNIIGFNSVGIVVVGSSLSTPSNAKIMGNWIGTDPARRDLGNLGFGIDLVSSILNFSAPLNVQVGAPLDALESEVARYGNHISHNDGVGVRVGRTMTSIAPARSNVIRGNAIRDNDGLPIDLYRPGPSTNDFLDVDGGTNRGMNYPVLGPAEAEFRPLDGTILTDYQLDTGINFPVTVDFYLADSTGVERWIGSDIFENGDVADILTVAFPAPTSGIPALLRATATDVDGNTSEYGAAIAVPEPSVRSVLGIGGLYALMLRSLGMQNRRRGRRE